MPLVDMPVEQLFKYQGVSPCPTDIDEYWDSALAEMNSLNHNAQFIKKDFPYIAKRMKAELLMFTGLMDTVCPSSTQFAMYNKIISKKDVIFYPEYGHEELKGAEDIIFEFLSTL